MAKSRPLVAHPARTSIVWYLGLILVGAALLAQPFAQQARHPMSLLDSIFTATSAACVTGLSVRSTGLEFSLVGQVIILLLVQIGGIGIMTVTTFVTFHLRGRAGLRERAIIAETLGGPTEPDLRWVLRNVVYLTVGFELVGFLLLAGRMFVVLENQPLEAVLWSALFHSICAFCNAGFSLYDNSLMQFQDDPLINLTIAGLIIVGGIGFPVLLDIRRTWRNPWRMRWQHLSLHSKMMLIGTVALLLLGTAAFLLLEWDGVLLNEPLGEKLLISFFQSTTCRTAGFNTVDIADLTNATLFVMMLLMMIGAGPCSTGGGFKVSTFMSLVLRARATFLGFHRVNVYRRTLEQRNIERATTTALIFAVVAALALTSLLVVEQSGTAHREAEGNFLEAMFEVISALGTVGLSTGITERLNEPSQFILIVLMFAGRLGPISMFIALSHHERSQRLEFPHEELLIG